MNSLLLDTHTAVWYLRDPARLSHTALERIHASIENGVPLFVSIISLIELVYLVEKGRVPIGPLDDLKVALGDSGADITILPIEPSILDAVEKIHREKVPDMPDRIIAATALHRGLSLVTRDRQLQESEVETIW